MLSLGQDLLVVGEDEGGIEMFQMGDSLERVQII